MAIAVFFLLHWWGSVFFQTFFHHRYASHRMYTMGPRTERVVQTLAYLFQGSSYLDVRAYALLHREHHAYSDTARDPHSPMNHRSVWAMMWATKQRYDGYVTRSIEPEPRFLGGIPQWPALDRLGRSWAMRLVWGALYAAFYVAFATAWWQFLFLPIHFLMGPIHGAIVNWCGHRHGYRNFASTDRSRNTLPIDVLTLGELFQNNHHHASRDANFGRRWFEIDPTYAIMRVLARLGAIRIVAPPRLASRIATGAPIEVPQAV